MRPLDSSLHPGPNRRSPGEQVPGRIATDGVIVRFGIKSATADLVTFRLARLSGEGATGAGTGSVVLLPGAGTYSFPADTRVRAGDYVGVDTSSVSAYSTACGTGGREFTYHPTLLDGGPLQHADSNSTCEFLVNAKVRPSNRFTFDGVSSTRTVGPRSWPSWSRARGAWRYPAKESSR